ncbi:diaminopimelate epimerase, partial [candidate division KSB1 bacterium]|nr:diaminopimelate epimerase [candidate division KSB1 bacterium]
MPINFLKISATGNDFILIDNRDGRLQAVRDAAFFSRICRRRRSVGADGVILLESSKEADFRYVHINADGSIAEMCGNGSRAIVHFAARLGIIDKTARFEINGNIYHAVVDGNRITTEFIPPGPYRLDVDIITEDGYTAGGLIDTGVPHFVIFVEDVQGAEVER